ncbi:hypothetical protein HDU87_008174 [Geranomyces variabilis]|uniref:C2H2-type domain-containing protein n=1 Tax=Geranomyces variabilis TaxID=109894 RepID=A0AAD5TDL4_9FUNG|nr:hypothetical protein HDU87_008174 [Geranomyces variabilis]
MSSTAPQSSATAGLASLLPVGQLGPRGLSLSGFQFISNSDLASLFPPDGIDGLSLIGNELFFSDPGQHFLDGTTATEVQPNHNHTNASVRNPVDADSSSSPTSSSSASDFATSPTDDYARNSLLFGPDEFDGFVLSGHSDGGDERSPSMLATSTTPTPTISAVTALPSKTGAALKNAGGKGRGGGGKSKVAGGGDMSVTTTGLSRPRGSGGGMDSSNFDHDDIITNIGSLTSSNGTLSPYHSPPPQFVAYPSGAPLAMFYPGSPYSPFVGGAAAFAAPQFVHPHLLPDYDQLHPNHLSHHPHYPPPHHHHHPHAGMLHGMTPLSAMSPLLNPLSPVSPYAYTPAAAGLPPLPALPGKYHSSGGGGGKPIRREHSTKRHSSTTPRSSTTATGAAAAETAAAATATSTSPIDHSSQQHECPSCAKTFSKPLALKAHIKSHALERTYQCDSCDASFRRSHDLKRHFRSIHTVIKPFGCDTCHKRFSRMDALKRHTSRQGSPCYNQYQ